jgi:flagellar motor protein MotB
MKPVLRWIFLSLLLAACSAPSMPELPELPDGRNRRQVNTSERIDVYREQLARNAAPKTQAPADQRHSDARQPQVATTPGAKTALSDTTHAPTGAPASQPGGTMHLAWPPPEGLAVNEAVQFHPRSMLFSVPCAFGDAGFTPSDTLRQLLLDVASHSPRIEVRGRTDADAFNNIDHALALRRAQQARHFLIRHGIAANRIHASALAYGGHAADNGTEDGRAQNRRIDIEVMDIDPLVHRATIPRPEGERHESN